MRDKLNTQINKILTLLGVTRFSHALIFAVYSVFLLERGLSIFQVGMVNLVYHIAVPILEAPTGAFADHLGRKKAFFLSNLFAIVSFFLYAASHSFIGFAVAEVFSALFFTFSSGATDAHLWETIEAGQTETLSGEELGEINRDVSVRKEAVIRLLGAIGGGLGPILSARNLSLPWILGGLSSIAVLFLGLYLIEDNKVTRSTRPTAYHLGLTSLKAIKDIFGSRALSRQATIAFFQGLAIMPVFMYWSVHLKNISGDWKMLGVGWLFIEISGFIGVVLGKVSSKSLNDRRLVMFGTLLLAFSIYSFSLTRSFLPALIALFVVEIFESFTTMAITIKSQKEIHLFEENCKETYRATLLSVLSMSRELGYIISLIVGGLIAERYTITHAWYIASFVVLISFGVQLFWKENSSRSFSAKTS